MVGWTYLIGSLGDISLEHQSLFNFMENGLGLVESSSVNTDYSLAASYDTTRRD
jgi:hypothetical protein